MAGRCTGALALCALFLGVFPVAAQDFAEPPLGRFTDSEGPRYWVSRIALEYATAHPHHPPVADLMASEYALGTAGDGYVGPRRGGENLWFALHDLEDQPPVPLYASGIRELSEQIVDELNARGLIGVYVAPHRADIDPETGRDQRPEGEHALRLVIYTGRVKDLRTFATASGIPEDDRTNLSRHDSIRSRSPIGPDARGDLIQRDELDRYVARLNRHPARFVDVVLTPGVEPGRVYVDYLVEEDRPWTLYSEVSDTGTDQTSDWRQRFGFAHHQLTGVDDTLSLDYITADFDDVHAFFGAYERPVPFLPRTRLRFDGSFSEYTADVFGAQRFFTVDTNNNNAPGCELDPPAGCVLRQQDADFSGEQWWAGFDLIASVYQTKDSFVDLHVGGKFRDVEVTNAGATSATSFVSPAVALSWERHTWASRLYGRLGLEGGFGADQSEIDFFGRIDLDDNWTTASWDVDYLFYLEPMLRSRRRVRQRPPRAREMKHEIALSTSGQWSFNRLIPQAQGVLGGQHSIRGYPQSAVAGDNVASGSVEYRYHWPLSLDFSAPRTLPLVGPFRLAPQNHYSRPDWDLVLRAFLDVGFAQANDAQPFEDDQTLVGAGVGVEMMIRRNLSLRLDFARAMRDVRDDVESGDTETHLSAVVRY